MIDTGLHLPPSRYGACLRQVSSSERTQWDSSLPEGAAAEEQEAVRSTYSVKSIIIQQYKTQYKCNCRAIMR